MTRVLHFVRKPELRAYSFQGKEIELVVDEKVFPPSAHGSFFADNLVVNPGETVIDIGTGSGLLAVLAAKSGGITFATDRDRDAIKLARENAVRNKVRIDFEVGQYFAGFERKFDVIIANLPQEIVHKSYQKAIGKKLSKTIHGGPNGNKYLLEFLDTAKNFIHENSRIYLIVYSLTDYASTIRKIVSNYSAKLVAFDPGPTKEFVEDNIEFYLRLNQIGKIKIFKEKEKWKAHEYLFELRKK